MPTFPKLIAAFWFALLAWFCAELVKNHFPENMIEGRMSEISAVIGFLVGWIFAGRRAGDTMRAALWIRIDVKRVDCLVERGGVRGDRDVGTVLGRALSRPHARADGDG